jgi:HlyD family secretion protein
MELHVDVDEADVGQVKEGQQAVFMVDAYSERIFPAEIIQVRYGSQEVDGVITYETVLNVDNSDLSLRPGMTATSDIIVEEIENGVLVPNAGLRFTPQVQKKEVASKGSLLGSLFRRPASRVKKQAGATNDKKQQLVWVLHDDQPIAVPITIGLSDGVMTELVAGDIEPGTPIIIDVIGVQK